MRLFEDFKDTMKELLEIKSSFLFRFTSFWNVSLETEIERSCCCVLLVMCIQNFLCPSSSSSTFQFGKKDAVSFSSRKEVGEQQEKNEGEGEEGEEDPSSMRRGLHIGFASLSLFLPIMLYKMVTIECTTSTKYLQCFTLQA